MMQQKLVKKTGGIHVMVKNRKWEKMQELCSFTPRNAYKRCTGARE